MRVYGVTGRKNTGKTGLMERLVAGIVARGLTVSTIKHAHHGTEIDQPGRDSHRHRQAGAQEVVVASPRRWALMHELRGAGEPPLSELLARMSPVDLILIEGYKRARHPKIETCRGAVAGGAALLAGCDASIRAVASDSGHPGLSIPVFGLDDTDAIIGFILAEVGL